MIEEHNWMQIFGLFFFFQSKFCCRWAPLSCRALQSKVSWSNCLHLILFQIKEEFNFFSWMIVYKFCKYFTNCVHFVLLNSEIFQLSWKKNWSEKNQNWKAKKKFKGRRDLYWLRTRIECRYLAFSFFSK